MNVRIFAPAAFALAALALPAASAAANDPSGSYQRKNGDLVQVTVTNGALYCKIIAGSKPNFEMCHGMKPKGDSWFGKKMKHPGMPRFMTFNGTVTFDATSLSIKGCAMGKAMCDSEKWTKLS